MDGCFIEPFCNTTDRVIERQNQNAWEVWWLGAVDASAWAQYADLRLETLPFGCRYLGIEVNDLADLEHLPLAAEIGIYAKPRQISRFVDRTVVRNPLLVSASEPAHLDCLLSGSEIPGGVEIEIELNQRTAPWLLLHRERLRQHLPCLRLHQPSHEFLKDAVANDVRNPKEFFLQLDLPVRASGLPACLTPHTELVEAPKLLSKTMFDPESGRLALRELAREHVMRGYWGKSVRCRDCRLNDRCDGAQINFLRDQGFGKLEPLRSGEWADNAEAQVRRLRPEPPKRLRDGKPVEPVAPSLPGYAPPQAAPVEPLIVLGQRLREERERRRGQLQAPPPA
jgi:hypothetical protein